MGFLCHTAGGYAVLSNPNSCVPSKKKIEQISSNLLTSDALLFSGFSQPPEDFPRLVVFVFAFHVLLCFFLTSLFPPSFRELLSIVFNSLHSLFCFLACLPAHYSPKPRLLTTARLPPAASLVVLFAVRTLGTSRNPMRTSASSACQTGG